MIGDFNVNNSPIFVKQQIKNNRENLPLPPPPEGESESLNEKKIEVIKPQGFFGKITQFFKKIMEYIGYAKGTVCNTFFIAVAGVPSLPKRPN